MAVLSSAVTLSPLSLSDFSVDWISDSAWFLASIASRWRLSASALASAS
jgi:hypothetical protein